MKGRQLCYNQSLESKRVSRIVADINIDVLRTRLEAAHWTKSISRGGDLVEEVDSDVDVDHVVGDLVADGHVDGDKVVEGEDV